jgi:pimeloyl-ACP methyl ester carboxylesterase
VAEKAWRPFEERSQAVMQKRLLRLCSLPSQDGNGLLCRSEAASRNDRDGWYLGLQALKTWDMRDWLASTATPVRILLAEDDALLPSAALQAKIPGSQLVPGGHTSIYTHPQACYAKLKEFWHEL